MGKKLVVTLKYGDDRKRSIAGVRRISKPGLRVYAKSNQLPKVLGGMGVAIISTSQGLMTDRQAHEKSVAAKCSPTSGDRNETDKENVRCHELAGSPSPSRPASR